MSKTLYITDLDGTLMKNDKSISEYTTERINALLDQGMLFTYATARSLQSASAIVQNLHLNLPVIIRNGTILADPVTKSEMEIEMFSKDHLHIIRQCMKGFGLHGFVTTYIDGKDRKLYLEGKMNEGFKNYLAEHSDDKRLCPVRTEEELFDGEVCYFTFIGDRTELDPFYERVKDHKEWICVYQQDKYRPEYWLEICPKNATKATAIQKIQKRYQCDRLVVFGDSKNDVSMFQIADEAYAVGNAMDELKKIATGIISSNEEDGVAKWIEKDYVGM